ncbi:MAG: c-type cytochrome [Rubripirellula sp.]|nr:c-type cytochrome [Rubripirellula sp.]
MHSPRKLLGVLCLLLTGPNPLAAQQAPRLNQPAIGPVQPAPDAPQPLSPRESAAAMQLPDGFTVDLIACEPVVTEPSCIAWDERGRLFVCELHGYNIEGHLDVQKLNKSGKLDTKVRRIRWELQGGKIADQAAIQQRGVVKMLRDTNGDGQMDESVIWADDLPACYGIVAARGGVIVTCAPDIVYLADLDHDGKPDVRETLLTGFRKRVMERGINNPRWGLDNWIYVGGGGEGGEITGPKLAKPFLLGNTDFRIKSDGSAIEAVNGRVGTFGMTINDIGDRFPASGGQPATYALPLPYRYLRRNPFVETPATNQQATNYHRGFRISDPHPWRVRRRQDPAWIKFYGDRETDSNYFSGGCSNEVYSDPLFPTSFRGNLFYCEPSLNMIHRCILERDGSGYRGRRAAEEQASEFLASTDQWFRPMNLRVGPDGALYIVDMYREIIEDYSAIPRFLQQQYGLDKGGDHGRIWRLRPQQHSFPTAPDNFRLSDFEDQQLADLIGSPYRWIRQTASRLLMERKSTTVAPTLRKMVQPKTAGPNCITALATLQGIGLLSSADVSRALKHPHYGVRIHALRTSESILAKDPAWVDQIASLQHDPDPTVRLQLAMTLGESHSARMASQEVTTNQDTAANVLSNLAEQHPRQQWMQTAILSSAIHHAENILGHLLRNSSAISPIISPPTDASTANPLIKPLAATLAAQRDGSALGHLLSNLLTCPPPSQRETLQGLLAGLSRGNEPAPNSQNGYAPLLRLIQSTDADVQNLATKLAGILPMANDQQLQKLFKQAADIVGDETANLPIRLQSLETLASAPTDVLIPSVGPLLDSRQPPEIQQAAAKTLNASTDPQAGTVLIANWDSNTPATRKAIIDAMLARIERQSILLDAIERGIVGMDELSDLQREQLIASHDTNIAQRAKQQTSTPNDQEIEQRLERYRSALAKTPTAGQLTEGQPDIRKGMTLYRKHCLMCHSLNDEGHQVGPHLGTIVNRPDETLLMDLLDPSGRIEPEYRSYLVITKDGRAVAGLLASETATGVVLRRENGLSQSVLRTDIDQIKAAEVSLMPGNLHEQLTPTDLANLISFLRQSFRESPSP